ncbi:MAG: DUF11 domain-containing protein, partial [Gammaproteobacteria bacterium]|nr:DUF11 domain-containing protein [Gammaproteobacteria bacterium]
MRQIGFLLPWRFARASLALAFALVSMNAVGQQVPITLYESLAGDLNYVVTGGSLRTQPNSGPGANACAVGASSANPLNGIPTGSTITRAYLYWAGSYSTAGGSTRTTPDLNVFLNGVGVSASRNFLLTFPFGTTNYDYFSGFADVTAQVAATGNAMYTVSGLSVNTATPHCAVAAVLAGWSMVVVYENATTERLRVINLFDGFQFFRGSSITLTPNNFVAPANPDGKHTVVTWEGDVENSAPLGLVSETLSFNGTPLIDGFNPTNNQFNSTINSLGNGSNVDFGVDIDTYDVSALISAGDTSASTIYASGADLVLLQLEVFSAANVEVADLALTKSHSGNFVARQNNDFSLTVVNNGPRDDPGQITINDTLPAGLTFASAVGSGWSCSAVAQDVTCTHPGPIAVGQSLPPVTLSVLVDASVAPSVTNTAVVSSPTFDNVTGNDQSIDTATVDVLNPSLRLRKTVRTLSDPISASNPKAIPGAEVEYIITATNQGPGPVDANTVVITDVIPSDLAVLVSSTPADPISFVDGSPPTGLGFSFASDVAFSNAGGGGAPFNYTPTPDADGYDSAVTGVRVGLQGIFPGATSAGDPSFEIRIRAK